jgi:hypothetical protein
MHHSQQGLTEVAADMVKTRRLCRSEKVQLAAVYGFKSVFPKTICPSQSGSAAARSSQSWLGSDRARHLSP